MKSLELERKKKEEKENCNNKRNSGKKRKSRRIKRRGGKIVKTTGAVARVGGNRKLRSREMKRRRWCG